MTKPTYQQIAPLVKDYQVFQPWLHVTLECPASGFTVRARSLISEEDGRRDLWTNLKSSALTAVSMLMTGMTGELTSKLASAPEDDARNCPPQKIEKAILDAFLSVRGCFRFDGTSWVAKERPAQLTELEKTIKAYPLKGPREAELLTRCLVRLAALDGTTCNVERKFLARFATARDRLASEMPSDEELAEVRPEARPTLYLLAQTLAMVDNDFSEPERGYLVQLAQGLKLSESQVQSMQRAAAEFLVHQSLTHNPEPSADEISGLSALTSLPISDIEGMALRHSANQS
jgi:hypothetical protein